VDVRGSCGTGTSHTGKNAFLFIPKPAAMANTSLHVSMTSSARMLFLAIAAGGRYARKQPLLHADHACVYSQCFPLATSLGCGE
jgi:hypothetical protein